LGKTPIVPTSSLHLRQLKHSLYKEHDGLLGPLPEVISGLKATQIISKQTVRTWYKGLPITIDQEGTDDLTPLISNLIHICAQPVLTKYAKTLTELIDQNTWRRNYCPVCGGSPDFGYLETEVGARWLVCSRCDTEWHFQRLQCPSCGTTDQNSLSYYTDDNDLYRLYVCESCKCYLKVMDSRHTDKEILVPLERILTLDMDRQAQERGYAPCKWVISSN